MHVQTHALAGWCAGNLFQLSARERMFCMIAAAMADADGISALFGDMAMANWHHKLAHNLPFGILMAGVLAAFSSHRLKAFAIFLAMFHLHIVMDLLGSGHEWTIFYFWPAGLYELKNPHAWDLYSWQNICIAFALVACAIAIAIRQSRTPLEALMPSLDRQLVEWLKARARRP